MSEDSIWMIEKALWDDWSDYAPDWTESELQDWLGWFETFEDAQQKCNALLQQQVDIARVAYSTAVKLRERRFEELNARIERTNAKWQQLRDRGLSPEEFNVHFREPQEFNVKPFDEENCRRTLQKETRWQPVEIERGAL